MWMKTAKIYKILQCVDIRTNNWYIPCSVIGTGPELARYHKRRTTSRPVLARIVSMFFYFLLRPIHLHPIAY